MKNENRIISKANVFPLEWSLHPNVPEIKQGRPCAVQCQVLRRKEQKVSKLSGIKEDSQTCENFIGCTCSLLWKLEFSNPTPSSYRFVAFWRFQPTSGMSQDKEKKMGDWEWLSVQAMRDNQNGGIERFFSLSNIKPFFFKFKKRLKVQ